ncbi:MAG: ATP-dependent sacrificial sulfur transferase LarE [Lachnospiraceae bacterium]|nr:ATP-dependent sacrificial sulfur transferase LarE [Lachnospiraceae bacterium]
MDENQRNIYHDIDVQKLEHYFWDITRADVCLAFSGGVDSSLLLKVAVDAARQNGSKVYAVTFDSRLHPSCDLEIARQVARELGGLHQVIEVDELEQENIRSNPVNRCYLCKRHLFRSLKEFAESKGINTIVDGTNEDDMHVYRPGIRALRELEIKSPLADLHITKAQVKALAAFYGISVASRPSTPCMATRIPYGQPIDYQVLEQIAKGEEYLRQRISGNIRLRLHGNVVRLEVDESKLLQVLERRKEIVGYIKGLGFDYITLDLEGFRSGSMDILVEGDQMGSKA